MKKILQPVNGPVTQLFGENFKTNWGSWAYVSPPGHPGIDWSVMSGTPVNACDDGIVINCSDHGDGYGNLVILLHSWGVSLYGHNQSFNCYIGQEVEVGDIISYSGNTGFSTGPHLHFEIQVDGKAIDPQPYLTNNINEVIDMKLTKELIRRGYLSILRREPDADGIKTYLDKEMSVEDFLCDLGDSEEHRQTFNEAKEWETNNTAGLSQDVEFVQVDYPVFKKK